MYFREVCYIKDKYYKRANRLVRDNMIEEALTAFIAGVDHGCPKCAFGLLYTVFEHGSYTLSVDEAIGIFDAFYPDIRSLADGGDDDAMVMVAQGIRYGFINDYDEPYMLWLAMAARLGNTDAMSIIREIEMMEEPVALPPPPDADGEGEGGGSSAMVLSDGCTSIVYAADTAATLNADRVLISDADWLVYEALGIEDAGANPPPYTEWGDWE